MTNDDLLYAAILLMGERGLEGLTLRPLAERLGVTVSALSHRFGQKSDILAAICDAAASAELRILDRWRARIDVDGRMSCHQVAGIADALMDDLARSGAGPAHLQGQLIQAAALRPELRPHLQHWLGLRGDFWGFLAGRLDLSPGFDLAAVLHAYSIDEQAFGASLGDDAAYRWLRKLCLDRLCAGVLARDDQDDGWDLHSFSAVWLQLGEVGPLQLGTEPLSKTAREVAGHIGRMLMTQGADAVSYRSVGREAGMAASSLVYHFPRQTDLLRAGLDHILRRARAQLGLGSDGEEDLLAVHAPTVAAATNAVALATVRYPDLKPFVADLRRRRGENGFHHLRMQALAPERIDRLTAQVVSVASIGALLIQRAHGQDGEPAVMAALFDLCRSAEGKKKNSNDCLLVATNTGKA